MRIPLLHAVDVTAAAVCKAGVRRVGLLGTRFTMEQPFHVERLQRQGLEVRLPDADDCATVHRIIYEELRQGKLLDSSRDDYRRVMADLVAQGAAEIILGCTAIALPGDAGDAPMPLFDTTALHAQAAVDWMPGDA